MLETVPRPTPSHPVPDGVNEPRPPVPVFRRDGVGVGPDGLQGFKIRDGVGVQS